jgi:hypothetical protein
LSFVHAVCSLLEALSAQHCDLTAICAECAAELLEAPDDERLTLSILVVEGRVSLVEAFQHLGRGLEPARDFPLLAKLRARGYDGPADNPWNPAAALYGPLAAIERRLKQVRQQCDDAQPILDSMLRDDAVTA